VGQYKPRLDPLQLDYGSIRKVSAIGGGGVATKGAQAWEPQVYGIISCEAEAVTQFSSTMIEHCVGTSQDAPKHKAAPF
jgi:hypothetical protein